MNGKDLYEKLDSLYDLRQELQTEYDCQTFDILRGRLESHTEPLMDKISKCKEAIGKLESIGVSE